jgi:hypothetical protein
LCRFSPFGLRAVSAGERPVGRYTDSAGHEHPIYEPTWKAVLAAMDKGDKAVSMRWTRFLMGVSTGVALGVLVHLAG